MLTESHLFYINADLPAMTPSNKTHVTTLTHFTEGPH